MSCDSLESRNLELFKRIAPDIHGRLRALTPNQKETLSGADQFDGVGGWFNWVVVVAGVLVGLVLLLGLVLLRPGRQHRTRAARRRKGT